MTVFAKEDVYLRYNLIMQNQFPVKRFLSYYRTKLGLIQAEIFHPSGFVVKEVIHALLSKISFFSE
jgi:hypothetical protein